MFGRLLKTYGGIACCGLLALLLWWGWQDFHQTCRQIQEDVIRLHVLANSDSPSDQEIKLQVRDGVLKEVESIYRQGRRRTPSWTGRGWRRCWKAISASWNRLPGKPWKKRGLTVL